jgi:hypothetical protein
VAGAGPGLDGWTADLVAGSFTSAPAAVVHDHSLHVFALGDDRNVWHSWWDEAARAWSPWSDETGTGSFRSAPTAVVHEGRLHLFAAGDDGNLWHNHW